MADTVGSIEVQITANTKQFEDALARARQLAAGLKDIKIGGSGSSGLGNLVKDMSGASKATKEFAEGNRTLRDSFKEVAGALSVLQGPLGPLAGRFGFLGTLIGRVGVASAGAAVAIGGLALSANEAVDAFADEEKQLLTLEAVLKATSNAAGQTMRSLSDLADAISTTTLATDDQVRSAESLMLTFRKISGEEFPRALRAAQDLAAVGFGSIEGNARQLGRALEDPIRGLGALRRSGVTFSASQREVIRSLVETGQAVQAQREVLKAIEIQVGGAGAAQASGTTGAFHQLSEAVNNVTVVFGKWVVETLKIPEAARAAAAGLNALIDDGEKLKFTIFGYTVETERWVSKAQEAKEATEAATKSNLDYVRSMEKAREIQGQISRGELGGTLAPMQEKDQTQLIREAAERQAQLEKAIQAVNTVIYDAIQAYNVWGAPILAAANKQKELADNILTAHLELTKQRDALFRTSEQQKIYDLLIKNSIPPLSDEAKALAVVSHELNILTDAMQQAGAAGVNMDKLKEKMQSLETASVITGAGGQSPVVNRVKVTIDAIKRQMQLEREASAAEASAVTIEDKMNAARLRAQADNNSGLSEEIQLLKEDNAALLVKQNLTISQGKAEASRLLGQQQNLESQQLEIQLVGKSISEQTRLRTELQLTQEGKRRWAEEGIKYTAEVAAADKKYADQVAADAAKLSEANLQAQTNFVTQSMFLSQTEAKVAQAMNEQFGDQWQAHMQDTIAQQIRFNDVLQDTYATTRDFAGTFVDGMMAGKSATDALTDAMANLQKKLIDMALDAVIQGLFGLLLGSGTTGGNIFSNLVNFTSGGGTGGGTTTTQNPVRRYAEGGVVGSTPRPLYKGEKLQYDEYPAILHAGERVIPASGDDSKSPGISGANMIRMFGGTPKFEGGWGNFGSQAAAMAGAYTAGDTGYGGSGGSWGFTGGSPSGFGDQGSGEYRYSPGSGGAGGPVSIGRGGLTSGAGRLATGPFAIADAPASGRIGPLRSDVPNRGPLFRWSNPNFNLNPFDLLNPRVDEEFEFQNVDPNTPFLPPPNLPKKVPTLNTDSEGNVLGTEGGPAGVFRSLLPSNYWNSIRRTFGFHQGGYVGSTPGRARFVDSSIFIGAPRFADGWSSAVGQTSAPAGWGGSSNQSYSTTPSSSSGTSLGSGQSSGASYSYNAATYGGGGGGGGTSLGYGQSSGGYIATLSGSGQGTGSSIAYNAATYGGGGGGSGSFTASLGSGTSALSSPFSFATQAAASPTAYRGAFSLGGGFGSAFSALVTGGSTEAFGRELSGGMGGDTLGLLRLPMQAPGRPNVVYGQTGPAVTRLQQDLANRGYTISVDGNFGPETRSVLRQFEVDNAWLTGERTRLPGIYGPQSTLNMERREQGLITGGGTFGVPARPRGYFDYGGAPGLPGGPVPPVSYTGGGAAIPTAAPPFTIDIPGFTPDPVDIPDAVLPFPSPRPDRPFAGVTAGGVILPNYGVGTDALIGGHPSTNVRYVGPTGQMGYPFAGRPPAYGPGIPTGTTVPFPGSFAGGPVLPTIRGSRDTGGIGFGFEPTVAHRFSELQGSAPAAVPSYGGAFPFARTTLVNAPSIFGPGSVYAGTGAVPVSTLPTRQGTLTPDDIANIVGSDTIINEFTRGGERARMVPPDIAAIIGGTGTAPLIRSDTIAAIIGGVTPLTAVPGSLRARIAGGGPILRPSIADVVTGGVPDQATVIAPAVPVTPQVQIPFTGPVRGGIVVPGGSITTGIPPYPMFQPAAPGTPGGAGYVPPPTPPEATFGGIFGALGGAAEAAGRLLNPFTMYERIFGEPAAPAPGTQGSLDGARVQLASMIMGGLPGGDQYTPPLPPIPPGTGQKWFETPVGRWLFTPPEIYNRDRLDQTNPPLNDEARPGYYVGGFGEGPFYSDPSLRLPNAEPKGLPPYTSQWEQWLKQNAFTNIEPTAPAGMRRLHGLSPDAQYRKGPVDITPERLHVPRFYDDYGETTSGMVLHKGGVVGSTPVPRSWLPSSIFVNAPRFQGGLAADEYPAILHAGETVTPAAGRQRSSTPVQVVVNTPPAAAPNVTVNVMNNSSAQVSTNQSEEGGNFKLDIMIDEMVSSKMRDGGSRISKTLASMGARAQPVRR